MVADSGAVRGLPRLRRCDSFTTATGGDAPNADTPHTGFIGASTGNGTNHDADHNASSTCAHH